MKSYRLEIERRIAARGRNGEDLALINGDEPDEQLQEMIVDLSQQCPVSLGNTDCPFYILSGLSYASLTTLVKSFSRHTCLDLFDLELYCRVNHKDKCFSRLFPPPQPKPSTATPSPKNTGLPPADQDPPQP
jgi:hypothetical protein